MKSASETLNDALDLIQGSKLHTMHVDQFNKARAVLEQVEYEQQKNPTIALDGNLQALLIDSTKFLKDTLGEFEELKSVVEVARTITKTALLNAASDNPGTIHFSGTEAGTKATISKASEQYSCPSDRHLDLHCILFKATFRHMTADALYKCIPVDTCPDFRMRDSMDSREWLKLLRSKVDTPTFNSVLADVVMNILGEDPSIVPLEMYSRATTVKSSQADLAELIGVEKGIKDVIVIQEKPRTLTIK